MAQKFEPHIEHVCARLKETFDEKYLDEVFLNAGKYGFDSEQIFNSLALKLNVYWPAGTTFKAIKKLLIHAAKIQSARDIEITILKFNVEHYKNLYTEEYIRCEFLRQENSAKDKQIEEITKDKHIFMKKNSDAEYMLSVLKSEHSKSKKQFATKLTDKTVKFKCFRDLSEATQRGLINKIHAQDQQIEELQESIAELVSEVQNLKYMMKEKG